MANPDRPMGFRPVKVLNGGADWTAMVRKYPVGDVSADTGNNHGDIYLGDPVALASGFVLAANSGDTILGVVVGVGPENGFGVSAPFDPTNLEQRFVPLESTAATNYFVWVLPAEAAMFEIQSAADLDLALGASADFSTDAGEAHGSRLTSNSTAEVVAAVNNDIFVMQIPEYPDNDSTLANTRYHCAFRNPLFAAAF